MATLTQWTWVRVNSGSWWWTGRPGMLQFMGSQRVGHDWANKLNWTEASLSLLQGIFPTHGWNPGLPHCRQILYQLSHRDKAQESFYFEQLKNPDLCYSSKLLIMFHVINRFCFDIYQCLDLFLFVLEDHILNHLVW